ncbi:MAG TPA: hypothetical protein VLG47_05315 [Candidatus Saccharimonadales bacterium]|nr:hypothetical protein [Candidatus Saccharimonadales bacterium]
MAFADTKKQIDEYVQGKKWFYYLPVWLFGLYIFVALLGYDPNHQMPFFIQIAQSFDFMLHEMAHIVTAFLPPILCAASGSFSELLLGTLLIFTAFKTKGYFSVMICSLWFMLACQSAGVYMADARAMKLSLVSLGAALSGSDTATHDWHFVFGKLHILGMDVLIGDTIRVIGIIVGLAGILFAAWLMYKMAAAVPEKTPEEQKQIEEIKKANITPIDGFTSYPIGLEPKQDANTKPHNTDSKENPKNQSSNTSKNKLQ